MTTTSSTPSRSPRGGVARSGANGKGKTVKFRGLTLTLPPEEPPGAFFTIDNNEISDTLRLFLGDNQYEKVVEKCIAAKLGMKATVEELTGLVNECVSAYGITAGE